NLKWLMHHKYPNKKIIVWAHNNHISKNSDTTNKKIAEALPMGYHFTKEDSINQKTYILGFTQHDGFGRFANDKSQSLKVGRPNKHSLEAWLKNTKKPYAFLDFLPFRSEHQNQKIEFLMKTYPDRQARSDWYNSYDGIFF